MDRRAWIAGFFLSFLGACNWVDGACWLKSDDDKGSGAGGGPIAPSGGRFGDAPDPAPQAAGDPPPPPECVHAPSDACNQNCLTNYANNADKCDDIGDEAQRKACQASAYTAYMACRDRCTMIQSQWRKACEEQAEKCEADCRKKPKEERGACWSKCNNEYGECTKRCKDESQ